MTLPARPKPITLVVDSSALVALLLRQPLAPQIRQVLIDNRDASVMSSASVVECSIVLGARLGDTSVSDFDDVVAAARIVPMPVDDAQVLGARSAWQRFGKGRHPAALNFGDCFSYALARDLDVPLLCTGIDFAKTDIALALAV